MSKVDLQKTVKLPKYFGAVVEQSDENVKVHKYFTGGDNMDLRGITEADTVVHPGTAAENILGKLKEQQLSELSDEEKALKDLVDDVAVNKITAYADLENDAARMNSILNYIYEKRLDKGIERGALMDQIRLLNEKVPILAPRHGGRRRRSSKNKKGSKRKGGKRNSRSKRSRSMKKRA